MKTITQFESIIDLMLTLNAAEKCKEHLRKLRWRNGIICPHCQNSEKKIYEYKNKDILDVLLVIKIFLLLRIQYFIKIAFL